MNTFISLENNFPRSARFRLLLFIFLAAFLSFFPTPNAYSAQVTLAWDANSERDLAGYKIYYGRASRSYQFYVDVGNKTTCIISNLQDGNTYYFAVTAYNTSGKESAFSNEVTFKAQPGISPPGIATLVSPSGTIANRTPTYTWNAVPGATWYFLWVDDSTGNKIQQWYTAEKAGCPTGTGTCSVTPAIELAAGAAAWRIQTTNALGYGPWSPPMNFTVGSQLPGQTTLISPTGTISYDTPTYTWNAVSGSTWYFLWVDDSTGNKIQLWYTAEKAGCPIGTGTCSVTPAIELAAGAAAWRIQITNALGYGPWSPGMNFTVAP